MTTNKIKENKYLIMAILLLPMMIVGSLLVNFNIIDGLYLLLVILSIICYIRSK